jgi:hypothetical protein
MRVHLLGLGQDALLLCRVVPSAVPAADLVMPAAAKGLVVVYVLATFSGARWCPEGPTTHTQQITGSWHQGTPVEHRVAVGCLSSPRRSVT